MTRAEEIEAFTDNPQVAENQNATQDGEGGYTQIRAQIEKPLEPDLAAVVAAWPSLLFKTPVSSVTWRKRRKCLCWNKSRAGIGV